MDNYEDEFTGGNINCVATPTTSGSGKEWLSLRRSLSKFISGTCEKVVLEKKAPQAFEDSTYHIFTEGTQFIQWNSPKKTNSWIAPEDEKAGYMLYVMCININILINKIT